VTVGARPTPVTTKLVLYRAVVLPSNRLQRLGARDAKPEALSLASEAFDLVV
jgi:hypothetical protein